MNLYLIWEMDMNEGVWLICWFVLENSRMVVVYKIKFWCVPKNELTAGLMLGIKDTNLWFLNHKMVYISIFDFFGISPHMNSMYNLLRFKPIFMPWLFIFSKKIYI